jgi:hypothetical protein
MGRAAAKLGLWLLIICFTWLATPRLSPGGEYSIFDMLSIASLPFVAVNVSRRCDCPMLFFLFGCFGMLPLSCLLLGEWARYPECNEPIFAAIVLRACIPIVGVGFLCRALAVHWPKLPPPDDDGLCQECGYNLTGNVSGICPECGTKVNEVNSQN